MDVGNRVRLKSGPDELYKHAVAGAQGLVTNIRTDEYGFQQVYIEWDDRAGKAGEQADGWTFPDHFEEVGPAGLANNLLEQCSNRRFDPERDPEEELEYFHTLLEGLEHLAECSEGFMLISISNDDVEDVGQVYVPHIWSIATSKMVNILLETTILNLGLSIGLDHVHQQLSELGVDAEDDEGEDEE